MNLEELKKRYEEMGAEIKRLEEKEKELEWEWPVKVDKDYCYRDLTPDGYSRTLFIFSYLDVRIARYGMWWRTEEEARKWVKVHRALSDLQAEFGACDWDDEDSDKSCMFFYIGDKKIACQGIVNPDNSLIFNCHEGMLAINIREIIDQGIFTREDLIYYITYTPPRPRRVK